VGFTHIYTSFEGRLNRKPFWLGILLLVAVSIVIDVAFVIYLAVRSGMPASANASEWEPWLNNLASQVKLANFVLQLILLYPSAALMVKRLHDRNRPGYFAVFGLAPGLLYNLVDLAGVTSSDPAKMNVLEIVLLIVTIAVGIWLFIELGCLRGTVGSNRFGPDPLWAGFARAPAP